MLAFATRPLIAYEYNSSMQFRLEEEKGDILVDEQIIFTLTQRKERMD